MGNWIHVQKTRRSEEPGVEETLFQVHLLCSSLIKTDTLKGRTGYYFQFTVKEAGLSKRVAIDRVYI